MIRKPTSALLSKIGGGERYGLNVLYSPEGDNILETGGGIRRALPLLGDQPFLVMNADVFTDMPLPDISLPAGVDGHLVLVPRPAYRPHGDFDLDAGYVRNNDEPGLTFSGIAVYRPEFFAEHPVERFPLAPLLRAAADARTLTGSLYEGTWEDVGTPERLAAVNRG